MATQTGTFGDAPLPVAPSTTDFSFGDAMNLTFGTLKARFWQMFGLFMCIIPVGIILMIAMFAAIGGVASIGSAGAGATDAAAAAAGMGLAILVGYLFYFLLDAWLRSALLTSALSYQAGTPTSFGSSFGQGLKHTPMVFLISIAACFVYIMCYMVGYIITIAGVAGGGATNNTGLAIFAGIIGVILMIAGAVPAFYLWCRWYVNTAARVAEGTGFATSFHRSRDLTMGHKCWVLVGDSLFVHDHLHDHLRDHDRDVCRRFHVACASFYQRQPRPQCGTGYL
jgi:hypothetical protein